MKSFKQFHNTIVINEGINDPAIFKAVFMAGGPGSGKTFIAGKTALTTLGLVLINSDDIFEKALKKAGLEPTPEVIFSERGQKVIRPAAKALTVKKQDAALIGRLGFIIDGTGKRYDRIKTQRVALNRLGYDTMMLFVNTDLETALERNKLRARSLPDEEVEKMWKSVQNNIGKFQNLFKNDFLVLDNSKGIDYKKSTVVGYRHISKWVKKDHKNPIAKKWIEAEKKRRGISGRKARPKGGKRAYREYPGGPVIDEGRKSTEQRLKDSGHSLSKHSVRAIGDKDLHALYQELVQKDARNKLLPFLIKELKRRGNTFISHDISNIKR